MAGKEVLLQWKSHDLSNMYTLNLGQESPLLKYFSQCGMVHIDCTKSVTVSLDIRKAQEIPVSLNNALVRESGSDFWIAVVFYVGRLIVLMMQRL